jgi:hypothetical protein
MVTNLVSMVGVDSFLTAESTAAVRSFNRFGKLAWDRTAWPFNSVIEQVIPDLRVRSVQVGSGGASYTSAPTVAFSGGGGNSAAATATINADGEVNGIAVTNNGTAFTGVPTVSFSGGSGSGATATASMLTYIDFGTTISEIFRVTTNDPYGTASKSDLAFRNIQMQVVAPSMEKQFYLTKQATHLYGYITGQAFQSMQVTQVYSHMYLANMQSWGRMAIGYRQTGRPIKHK